MPHMPSLPDPAHLSDFFKLFPDNTAPLMAYVDGILRSKGELSIGERELIATFVSGLNACAFCHDSHKVYAEAFGIDGDLIDALVADVEAAPVSEKMRPLLRYVAKLNTLPSRIVAADVEAVYAAGWGEQAMYEAVSVCALFNMMNRLIEGAGLNFDYIANPEVHPAANGYSSSLERSYRAFGERLEAENKASS